MTAGRSRHALCHRAARVHHNLRLALSTRLGVLAEPRAHCRVELPRGWSHMTRAEVPMPPPEDQRPQTRARRAERSQRTRRLRHPEQPAEQLQHSARQSPRLSRGAWPATDGVGGGVRGAGRREGLERVGGRAARATERGGTGAAEVALAYVAVCLLAGEGRAKGRRGEEESVRDQRRFCGSARGCAALRRRRGAPSSCGSERHLPSSPAAPPGAPSCASLLLPAALGL